MYSKTYIASISRLYSTFYKTRFGELFPGFSFPRHLNAVLMVRFLGRPIFYASVPATFFARARELAPKEDEERSEGENDEGRGENTKDVGC